MLAREKGTYIFMDAAREARAADVPRGNFYDLIGDPAAMLRCGPGAASQGMGVGHAPAFAPRLRTRREHQ